MPNMKKILVATDFSNCASKAMEYALEIATLLNVEVCAIHAIGTNEGVNNNMFNAIYIEDYYNNKRIALDNWVNSFTVKKEYENVNVSSLCEVGSLSNVITKYIDKNPVEMLVMGTMGSSGISGIFGSNANAMVEKTKIPTLIIPLESNFTKEPVITLATDFSSKLSAEDIQGLTELIAGTGSKKLNVINIIEGNDWKPNQAGEENLKSLFPAVELTFKYINEEKPSEGIMNFVVSNQTDILCLVKHHHNLIYRIFNRSTVNQVMNKSIKAVLILHE
jgi:nucleotide-binding universal stress UspA family protein